GLAFAVRPAVLIHAGEVVARREVGVLVARDGPGVLEDQLEDGKDGPLLGDQAVVEDLGVHRELDGRRGRHDGIAPRLVPRDVLAARLGAFLDADEDGVGLRSAVVGVHTPHASLPEVPARPASHRATARTDRAGLSYAGPRDP